MNTKLSGIRLNRKFGSITAYFDEISAEFVRILKVAQPSVKRVLWVVVGEAVISLSILLVYVFTLLFSHTSYRFVSIFLLIILVSNVLAKIVSKFIETYND